MVPTTTSRASGVIAAAWIDSPSYRKIAVSRLFRKSQKRTVPSQPHETICCPLLGKSTPLTIPRAPGSRRPPVSF